MMINGCKGMMALSSESYDESRHSREVYAYFGLAVYYSQVLEHQLSHMIVLLRHSQGTVPTERDLELLFERTRNNTLGQLILELKHSYRLKDNDLQELFEVLRTRNYIVHDYFKVRINDSFTRAGRDRMIRELIEFKNMAASANEKMQHYTKALYGKLGYAQSDVEEEVRRLRESLLLE
ncbi:hypothetical protein [Paenibacillus sp. CECT 9249]|nr:hypothetical protein [Paenibacillus sp. CECT 9249]